MPDQMRRLVVVDGNNIVMRAYFAMANSNLRSDSGEPTGAIYGTISSMLNYIKELDPSHMVWFFDDGKSEMRVGLREDYKGHRKYSSLSAAINPQEDLPPQYRAIREFLTLSGIAHHSQHGVEADDLIAQAVIEWRDEFEEITIISSDHDLLQLVSDDPLVNVFRPGESKAGGVGMKAASKSAGRLYNVKQVVEKYGLSPAQLPIMWALTGDTGDNIQGIKGVGPKTAAKWVQAHGSLDQVLVHEPKCEGFERLCAVNLAMIILDGSVGLRIPFGPSATRANPDSSDTDAILAFFRRYQMKLFAQAY